jgi:hypothetical protein
LFHGGIPNVLPLLDVEKELPLMVPIDVSRLILEKGNFYDKECKLRLVVYLF